jgi:uncharacterized protein
MNESEVTRLCSESAARFEACRAIIRDCGSVLVAFSGGVDSTLVLKLAVDVLGDRAVALTATSPSVSDDEAEDATTIARHLGVRHLVVPSNELSDPRYAANPSNRCYFCKTELYSLTERHRLEHELAAVLDGFNADDRGDHRPGHQAAREKRVKSPLAEAGLNKLEIRAWSKRLGLPTWDKPQKACLASRLPYGTQVTVERLNQVGAAERALRDLGLTVFRVRHHGDVARIELGEAELLQSEAPELRRLMNAAVKKAGFLFAAVDLEPFRSGRMNDALAPKGVMLPVVREV